MDTPDVNPIGRKRKSLDENQKRVSFDSCMNRKNETLNFI
jgi:hypothetical protein